MKTIPIIPIPAADERPAHAFLGASSSKQWLSCTPSARAGEGEPDSDSEAAQEGTFAHGYAAAKLQHYLTHELQDAQYRIDTQKSGDWARFYTQDLEDVVQGYVDRCIADIEEARAECPDAVIMVEETLDFSPWVPAGFGTGDLVIIYSRKCKVRDLKFGRGVHVEVVDNSQLRLYAAGAYNGLEAFFEFDEITVTVDQPRMGNVASETIAVNDLLLWLTDYVQPRAQMAWNGEGEFIAGDWCTFCRFRFRCVARKDYALGRADESFRDLSDARDPEMKLSLEEITAMIPRLEAQKKWASSMLDWVEKEQIAGRVQWPGYKLVEGKSNRVITDPAAVADLLRAQGKRDDDIYHPMELKGITDLGKLIGKAKFDKLAAPYLRKPKGAPTLVPVSDVRIPWSPEVSPDDSFGGLE